MILHKSNTGSFMPNRSVFASRYWNPGDANGKFDDNDSWAATDGGTADQSSPTSSDDCFFTSTNVQPCDLDNSLNQNCKSIDCTGGTGYTGTWTDTGNLSVYGAVTLNAGMTLSWTGPLQLRGTGSHTLTTAGKTLTTISNLSTGTYTVSGNITTTGSGVTNSGGGTFDFDGNDLIATPTAFALDVESITGINNLTYTGGATNSGNMLYINSDLTITGALTVTGPSLTQRVFIEGLIAQSTVSAGSIDFEYADVGNIIGVGAASWDISAITGLSGDCGNNTNLTFTAADDNYWIGDTGTWYTQTEWSTSTGGAANGRYPLPQDTAIFDANSFSGGGLTVNTTVSRLCKMDWTNATNSPTLNITNVASFYGDMTFIAGMTVSGTTNLSHKGDGADTLTSAGQSLTLNLIENSSGSLTLADAYSAPTKAITLTNGTIDANDQNVTINNFASVVAAGTKVWTMGNGTWTFNDVAGTTISLNSTGLTINAESSTIKFVGALTGDLTFDGEGFTYNDFWDATTNAFSVKFTGSNTFADIKLDAGRTAEFTAGTTTTLTTLTAVGAGTTITSITAATHTLSCSAGPIEVENCTISYSVAQGGAAWKAPTADGNVDGGNNTGWNFTSGAANMFLIF